MLTWTIYISFIGMALVPVVTPELISQATTGKMLP
jgi:hypothetical protein